MKKNISPKYYTGFWLLTHLLTWMFNTNTIWWNACNAYQPRPRREKWPLHENTRKHSCQTATPQSTEKYLQSTGRKWWETPICLWVCTFTTPLSPASEISLHSYWEGRVESTFGRPWFSKEPDTGVCENKDGSRLLHLWAAYLWEYEKPFSKTMQRKGPSLEWDFEPTTVFTSCWVYSGGKELSPKATSPVDARSSEGQKYV